MKINHLISLVIKTLEDNKANDIQNLDVSTLTDITDALIICSAISTRHIDALKNKLLVAVKAAGETPVCVHGDSDSGWVLIDLHDVIVHIMLPETRDFYSLEKLWSIAKSARETETG